MTASTERLGRMQREVVRETTSSTQAQAGIQRSDQMVPTRSTGKGKPTLCMEAMARTGSWVASGTTA